MIKLPSTLIIALVLLLDVTSSRTLVLAQDSRLNTQVDNREPPSDQGQPTDRGVAGTQMRPQPPSTPMPTERKPAGTRGPCFEGDTDLTTPFTPLLPVVDQEFAGLTLTEHPTFWFYVPYPTSRVSLGKFSLEDQQHNTIYEAYLELSETPGFISVSLPATAKPLKNHQQYKWTFMLYGASDESYVFHQGLIEKIDVTSLKSQLSTITLKERITFYQNNSIWYDAATDLPQIRGIPDAWTTLLRMIGLEQLEQEPIIGSAIPIDESEFDTRIGVVPECEI